MLVVGCSILGGNAAARFCDHSWLAPEALPLRVMTFNLRYASPKPPNSWPERRPVMRNCIRSIAPDLIGTQEGLYDQLKDLASDLPDYDWLGLGREGGSRGEFMAVFYRRDRFEPLAYDHFWLSDTPAVTGSSTWGNTNRRMATWVRFRERPSGREFFFWNTHLDNDVELARQKGAALIVERVNQIKTDLPVLLTGDFNSAAGSSRAYEILVREGGFVDTWQLARERVNGQLNTFHGFKAPVEQGSRIDWILARGPVTVDKTEIVTCSENGQTPSDHFPVVAWLTLAAKASPSLPGNDRSAFLRGAEDLDVAVAVGKMRNSQPQTESSKYRTIFTIAGAGGGFVLGMGAGFAAYDDAINSSRKVWTTSLVGAAVGAVGGYFLGGVFDKRKKHSPVAWAPDEFVRRRIQARMMANAHNWSCAPVLLK